MVSQFELWCSAQVPCKDIIEHCRSSASTAPGIKELAEVSLGHSESGVHKVLADHGCQLPVPFQWVDLPTGVRVPYINMYDWVRFLGQSDRLEYLVGTKCRMRRRDLCLHFWERLQRIRPNHPAFQMAKQNLLDLRDTVPVLHHGDEGRTYKRAGIMILSTHGVLGAGCSKNEDGNKGTGPADADPMRLNFLGSSITRHFAFAALPASLYKDSPECLDLMLQLYAQDMHKLATEGIKLQVSGQKEHLFFMCIAAKGDLPYLAKSAHMTRTFASCPKQSSSKNPSKGICWMCLGGVEGRAQEYPWEDFSLHAAWLRTRGLEPAVPEQSPLLTIPNDGAEEFFRVDLWHVFHLGCGKSFVASSIVTLLEDQPGSVDERLRAMGQDFKSFCKRTHQYSYVSGFNRDLFGWEKASDPCNGHWYKGHLTTRLMTWLEDYLARHYATDSNPFVIQIASGFS